MSPSSSSCPGHRFSANTIDILRTSICVSCPTYPQLACHVKMRTVLPRILARALPGHAILSCEPLAGGLSNAIYRIHVAGLADSFVLRLYSRDRAACRKELDLHRLISPA